MSAERKCVPTPCPVALALARTPTLLSPLPLHRRLQDGLRAAAERKEAAQQQLWSAEASTRARLEELDAVVATYSDHALQLHLLPSTAKHAEGKDFDLQAYTTGVTPEEVEAGSLLSRDLRGDLRPLLRELRSRFVQRTHHARARLLEVQDEVEAAQEKKTEAERAADAQAAKLKQAEQQHAREQEVCVLARRKGAEEGQEG